MAAISFQPVQRAVSGCGTNATEPSIRLQPIPTTDGGSPPPSELLGQLDGIHDARVVSPNVTQADCDATIHQVPGYFDEAQLTRQPSSTGSSRSSLRRVDSQQSVTFASPPPVPTLKPVDSKLKDRPKSPHPSALPEHHFLSFDTVLPSPSPGPEVPGPAICSLAAIGAANAAIPTAASQAGRKRWLEHWNHPTSFNLRMTPCRRRSQTDDGAAPASDAVSNSSSRIDTGRHAPAPVAATAATSNIIMTASSGDFKYADGELMMSKVIASLVSMLPDVSDQTGSNNKKQARFAVVAGTNAKQGGWVIKAGARSRADLLRPRKMDERLEFRVSLREQKKR